MKKIDIKPKHFFNVLESTSRSQVAEMVLGPKEATGGPDNKHPESDQWLYDEMTRFSQKVRFLCCIRKW